ncbi:MAG: type II toxin-antitoxin system prevent-host-death family antitoxin [Proteobacteria bacterium]|nr:type II toxin-antitoxin system prevent-host-death family antitoxin [Pseudomonadota bacterium]
MSIPAAVFKAECLKLMDEVARTGQPVVITKHGKPVAQLAPVAAEPKSLFGYMKNTVTIKRDIVVPTDDSWSAVSGVEYRLYARAGKKPRTRRAGLKK